MLSIQSKVRPSRFAKFSVRYKDPLASISAWKLQHQKSTGKLYSRRVRQFHFILSTTQSREIMFLSSARVVHPQIQISKASKKFSNSNSHSRSQFNCCIPLLYLSLHDFRFWLLFYRRDAILYVQIITILLSHVYALLIRPHVSFVTSVPVWRRSIIQLDNHHWWTILYWWWCVSVQLNMRNDEC